MIAAPKAPASVIFGTNKRTPQNIRADLNPGIRFTSAAYRPEILNLSPRLRQRIDALLDIKRGALNDAFQNLAARGFQLSQAINPQESVRNCGGPVIENGAEPSLCSDVQAFQQIDDHTLRILPVERAAYLKEQRYRETI